MTAKLKEEKKREIYDHLEAESSTGNVLSLEMDRIAQSFSDDQYSESDINELVQELEEEDMIETKTAKFRVAYPSSHKEEIEEDFQHLFNASIFGKFIVGLVSYIALLEWRPFYELVSGDNAYPTEAYVSGALIGILASYALGSAAIRAYYHLQNTVPILEEHKYIMYGVALMAVLSSGAIVLASVYLGEEIRLVHVVGAVTASAGGGGAIGVHLSRKHAAEESEHGN